MPSCSDLRDRHSGSRPAQLVAAAAIVLACAAPAAVPDPGEYRTPLVTVPYAVTPPTLDGVVGETEWQGAVSLNALQTVTHAISPRQTRFWALWDEDNLYLAMRSPLRDGERPLQALRDHSRDVNVVFDDSYEVWIDAGTRSRDGQPAFFQFLSNVAGARYDVQFEPAVGNSRLGWTSGWQPRNRLTPDGKAWEWEMAIPRQSVARTEPFADGVQLRCLLARNYKRPWEQNSFEGTGSFSVCETFTRWVLAKSAPAVRLLAVADPAARTLGLHLGGYAATATRLHWSFASDGGVTRDGALDLPAGRAVDLAPALALDSPGPGNYRITVTAADTGTVWLDWRAARQFGDLAGLTLAEPDAADRVDLTLEFNPIASYLRVRGDFIGYDARSEIGTCQVDVLDAQGHRLAGQDLTLDAEAYVRGVLPVPNLPVGEYTARLTCLGRDGHPLLSRDSRFAKQDHTRFPWWNTTAGNIERVIRPWTPVTWRQGVLGVWGRETTVGAAGLPQQIVSQRRDLLAGPVTLVAERADGQRLALVAGDGTTVSAADHRVVLKVSGRLGGLPVQSVVTAEFDGLYRLDLTYGGGQPVDLRSLRLIVPLANATADYVHACGEGIRYGYDYGFLPRDRRGRVWDCRRVDSQPMALGSFIPYVWVGGPAGGLAWFADSDAGWVPDEQVPAIEIRRDSADSADLILNLVGAPVRVDAPRTVSFAFQATPVKPLHRGWRMDSWWCGDTFRDYSCTGDIIWTARPFTTDPARCQALVEAQHQSTNGFIFGVAKYRANAVPYFIHQSLPASIPEVVYFGDEWRTAVSAGLVYGKTLTDYMIHNLGQWTATCGTDGYYIDNMRPLACDNLAAGRGYRLPDGRVQPTYQMLDTRRYFLRLKAVFAEHDRHDKVVVHMTNNMIIPWVQAGGVAYDGEDRVIYPEMGKDFMDAWPLERLRVDYPAQWGVAVNVMHEYQGRWEPVRLAKAMRAYSGLVVLHDALPSGNANGLNQPLWIGRDRFGIEADDVEFLPYWEANWGVRSAAADVRVSAWRRPGRVLLAVANLGERIDAELTLDPTRLGLATTGPLTARDAEEGCILRDGTTVTWEAAAQGTIRFDGRTALTVPVERHDYRQVIVAGP